MAVKPVQRLLLRSGAVAAALYVALDLFAATRYPGYSVRDHAISELSAAGAPTATLWAVVASVFAALIMAFGVGVWGAASGSRATSTTGALLLALGASGPLWHLFPMHQRGAGTDWRDAGHIVLSVSSVALITGFIIAGGIARGGRFRAYSLVTLVAVLGAGIGTFAFTSRVAANEPTPWMGIIERVAIYGYLAWIASLSILMLRDDRLQAVRAR